MSPTGIWYCAVPVAADWVSRIVGFGRIRICLREKSPSNHRTLEDWLVKSQFLFAHRPNLPLRRAQQRSEPPFALAGPEATAGTKTASSDNRTNPPRACEQASRPWWAGERYAGRVRRANPPLKYPARENWPGSLPVQGGPGPLSPRWRWSRLLPMGVDAGTPTLARAAVPTVAAEQLGEKVEFIHWRFSFPGRRPRWQNQGLRPWVICQAASPGECQTSTGTLPRQPGGSG